MVAPDVVRVELSPAAMAALHDAINDLLLVGCETKQADIEVMNFMMELRARLQVYGINK